MLIIFTDCRLAAGGVLECVDRVMEDEVGAAWAVVRPPGHHAEVRMVRCVKVSGQNGPVCVSGVKVS